MSSRSVRRRSIAMSLVVAAAFGSARPAFAADVMKAFEGETPAPAGAGPSATGTDPHRD